ncbi:sigma-like protein [Streptomyces europaeiscabiei]|uniref:sigma-like protein n=1 Tax=Streptomyces europaeiscabiei TaxID=146819 RepID=UPI002E2A317A|nr:sigma-like protein [Streptomyces europaeiscabiei]
MSSTEKTKQDEGTKAEEITTLDSHMPAPPADDVVTTQDSHMPAPPADDTITTKDSHMPAPPALDLGGK